MNSWSSPRPSDGDNEYRSRPAGFLAALSGSLILVISAHLWAQETELPTVLPKDAFEKMLKDAQDSMLAAMRVEKDLQLSIADERVLLHLPRRGFPNLAFLASYPGVANYAMWPPNHSDGDFKKGEVREEGIIDELLRQSMFCRVKASQLATFRLLKELAPSPAALEVERQAGEVRKEMTWPLPSAEGFLQRFKKLQKFFDRLKDLPKLTPEEWTEERAQTAVLTFAEYPGAGQATQPVWPDTFLDWHRKWNHEGYILAFSGADGPQSFVVREHGAVFAWNQAVRIKTGTGINSVESRLSEEELRALQEFLPKLAPSDSNQKHVRYVVSFLQDGQWITRTYHELPTGSPFPAILRQMGKECGGFVVNPGEEFRKPAP